MDIRSVINIFIRCSVKPILSPEVPIWLQRMIIGVGGILLRGTPYTTKKRAVDGVRTCIITPPSTIETRGTLYLHGGGYVLGGRGSHAKLAARVGQSVRSKVWLPDYRLAPEKPYPHALNDALRVYLSLIKSGQAPHQLVLAGDSAGAGLALATAIALRDAALPLPRAIILYSPWVDLSLSGRSIETHLSRDSMLKPDWLSWCADAYRGALQKTDAECSPLFATLEGLPPILIHVGSEEILLDDSLRLTKSAQKAGLNVEFSCFEGVGHVFQLQAGIIDEADRSLRQTGEFIERIMRQ